MGDTLRGATCTSVSRRAEAAVDADDAMEALLAGYFSAGCSQDGYEAGGPSSSNRDVLSRGHNITEACQQGLTHDVDGMYSDCSDDSEVDDRRHSQTHSALGAPRTDVMYVCG